MTPTRLATAALAAIAPMLPLVATAQSVETKQAAQTKGCPEAIGAVEQQLQRMKQRDNWNRAQVQLYIADQFLSEGQPKDCLEAVQEAWAILGRPGKAADTAQAADSRQRQAASRTDAADAATGGGSNIDGAQPEGWGTNEAQPVGGAPQQAGNTSVTSQDQNGASTVAVGEIVGKSVRIPTGEAIGKIVGVAEEEVGPQRVIIGTGKAEVAVAPSTLHYDKTNNVVIVDMTEAELEDALAAPAAAEGPAQTNQDTGKKMEQ